MSSNTNNSNNTSQQQSQPADNRSNYAVAKEAGYANPNHLYLSYGLKMHDPDQLAEGKAILQGLRENDHQLGQSSNSARK